MYPRAQSGRTGLVARETQPWTYLEWDRARGGSERAPDDPVGFAHSKMPLMPAAECVLAASTAIRGSADSVRGSGPAARRAAFPGAPEAWMASEAELRATETEGWAVVNLESGWK